MPMFPFLGFPPFYRRNYNYYPNYNFYNSKNPNFSVENNQNIKQHSTVNQHLVDKNLHILENTKNNTITNNSDPSDNDRNFDKKNPDNSYFFELFGLKLYFDDILLISLIFFLYNEGVKDEGLFIALILLLLS